MTNSEFLETFQHLLYKLMYQYLIDLDFASVSISNKNDSEFFNYAFINSVLDLNQIRIIEEVLKDYSRIPTFYFEQKTEMIPMEVLLDTQKYKKKWNDIWFFHDGVNISQTHFYKIKKVTTPQDLATYLEVFYNSFVGEETPSSIGDLKKYLDISKDAWLRHQKSGRIEYFIAYDDNVPCAVSALINFSDIGYVLNVGSLPAYRGRGFGRLATQYCVIKSIQNGNSLHCLATEKNSKPVDFYTKIGFVPKFSAVGYSLF